MVERGACKHLASLVLRCFSLPCVDPDPSVLSLSFSYLLFPENGELQETIIRAIDSEARVFEHIRVGSNFKEWKVNQMLDTS